jgi:class 3 adenylate cyclase/TolB-like protein/tetratricopeptide (TPR) repeat protein
MAVLDQPISSRKLAAILSADVAGYSALMSADEEGTVRKLREVRDAVLPIVERFGGRIIDLAGDGILAEFPSAVRAVESAAAVQTRMEALNARSEPRMVFRIGVNVGDVIHEGDRLYGDGINVAARLQAIAEPGGICISNKVHEEVRDRVKLAFRDMGDQELKNIARPVRAFSSISGTPPSERRSNNRADARPAKSLSRRFVLATCGALLGLAIVLSAIFAYRDDWKPVGGQAPTVVSQGPTVAVGSVENKTGDTAKDSVASELTQGLISNLSRFGDLRVLGRNATAAYKGRVSPPEELRSSVGADFAVNASLRSAGKVDWFDVQLSDTRTGTQVWSNSIEMTGDRTWDEIAGIASAMIGSYPGAITAAEFQRIQSKPVNALSSHECFVQGVMAASLQSPPAIAKARACLDSLLSREPNNAFAWAALVSVLLNQRNWGIALPEDQVLHMEHRLYLNDRILDAALKAVELAPNDAYVRSRLAVAYFANCQRDLLRVEAYRAIQMNPNDMTILGALGLNIAFVGYWDEAFPLVERALATLGAGAPRVWWWVPAKRHWLRGEYQQAYEDFQKSYIEELWLSHLDLAYTLPFLDRIAEAKEQVAALLKMQPGFTIRQADAFYRMVCFEPAFREKMRGALRLAGLPE